MNRLSILIVIFVFSACAAKLTPPTSNEVAEASKHYPGITISDLESSKALYENSCSACHPAKNPTSRTEAQWLSIMPRMVEKSKKKGYEITAD
ncbi:MAG: hypothetical protein WED33_13385, partial [Bacteroidia bacterium]